jgi:hypothetical protein
MSLEEVPVSSLAGYCRQSDSSSAYFSHFRLWFAGEQLP